MAKREISTTLRNLKFMQRAAQKVEVSKPKVEEEEEEEEEKRIEVDNSFGASPTPRRCIVIMEGNPQPGALKGRMSFQSFNPSVDKLHEENDIVRKMQASIIWPQNGSPNSPANNSDPDHKRKQPEIDTKISYSSNSPKKINEEGSEPSSSQNNSKGKQQKREKLDFNFLRSPKSQTRKS